MADKRVVFDFELTFANGGGLQGQGFRLDIEGDGIDDDALAAFIIRDLRLLMVDRVTILNKRIIEEPHKRAAVAAGKQGSAKLVDLSHVIEGGMITYKGLPAPIVCDHISRVASRASYAAGTEFQIGRIEMVGNTGTYLDTPYHRFADGYDLAQLPLDRAADLPGVVIRVTGAAERAIDWPMLAAVEVKDRAVLIETGWSRHWRTDAYFEGHPYLTEQAAIWLRDQGALLVGIDSLNIDDTGDPTRPVHTTLLGAGIPIVEHLCNLDAVPAAGFRFSAVPARVRGIGTFPVRAFGLVG